MVNKAVSLMSMDFSVGDLRLIFVCFDHWTSFFELAFFFFEVMVYFWGKYII